MPMLRKLRLLIFTLSSDQCRCLNMVREPNFQLFYFFLTTVLQLGGFTRLKIHQHIYASCQNYSPKNMQMIFHINLTNLNLNGRLSSHESPLVQSQNICTSYKNVLFVQTCLPKVRVCLLYILLSLAHLGSYLGISKMLSLLPLIHLNW